MSELTAVNDNYESESDSGRSTDFREFLEGKKQELKYTGRDQNLPNRLLDETNELMENYALAEGLTEVDKVEQINDLFFKFYEISGAVGKFKEAHPEVSQKILNLFLADTFSNFDSEAYFSQRYKSVINTLGEHVENNRLRKVAIGRIKTLVSEVVAPEKQEQLNRKVDRLEANPDLKKDRFDQEITVLEEATRYYRKAELVDMERYRAMGRDKYENTFFTQEEARDWEVRFENAETPDYMKRIYRQLNQKFRLRQRRYNLYVAKIYQWLPGSPEKSLEGIEYIRKHYGEAAFSSERVQSLHERATEAQVMKAQIESAVIQRDTLNDDIKSFQQAYEQKFGKKLPIKKMKAPKAANDNEPELKEDSPEAVQLKLTALNLVPTMVSQANKLFAKYGFTDEDDIYNFANYGAQAKVDWMKSQPSVDGGERSSLYEDYRFAVANDNLPDDPKLKTGHFAFEGFSISQENFTVAQARKIIAYYNHINQRHPLLMLMSYAMVVDPEKFKKGSVYSATPNQVLAAAAYIKGNLSGQQLAQAA